MNITNVMFICIIISCPQNHPVERIWVEVNSRVNYPIKKCLINMEDNHLINMDNDHHKFLTSYFSINVAKVGTQYVVDSWNRHRIPGIGPF